MRVRVFMSRAKAVPKPDSELRPAYQPPLFPHPKTSQNQTPLTILGTHVTRSHDLRILLRSSAVASR
jgi:hypothetical protein